jgi:hypothetical protein
MANSFSYTYKPVDFATAQKQVSGQVDPLFQRAIQGVQQQKYANDVQAGSVAASRGLGHSGLAADQLNKIAIAAQGQIGDLNAQKASQIAQMSNDLVWRDKEYSLQNRGQLYNEWNNNRNFTYQQGRDKVADGQWNKQFDYTKGVDNRNFKYQVGRDKVSDNQWNQNFTYQKGRDKVTDSQWNKTYNHQVSQDALAQQWKNKEWSQMSPAEKARMALEYSYSKKSKSGGGGGNKPSSKSVPKTISKTMKSYTQAKKSQSKTALDKYYTNPVIQNVESRKLYNDEFKIFGNPLPPAQNPYLSDWDRMKMMGVDLKGAKANPKWKGQY